MMPIRPGANQGFGFPISGPPPQIPSGGSAYTAKAVHFDGATMLQQLNSAIADSFTGVCSVYAKFYAVGLSGNPTLFETAVDNNLDAFQALHDFSSDFAAYGVTDIGLNLALGASPGTADIGVASDDGNITTGVYNHFFAKWDTNAGDGSKNIQIRLNGADPVDPTNSYDGSAAAKVTWATTAVFIPADINEFSDGNPGYSPTDMADFQLFTDIDISLATLDLFNNSGKPVDPAAAATVLGPQKILFQRTNSDPNSFAVNQGTGGAFTVTGTLTNATTSPSD